MRVLYLLIVFIVTLSACGSEGSNGDPALAPISTQPTSSLPTTSSSEIEAESGNETSSTVGTENAAPPGLLFSVDAYDPGRDPFADLEEALVLAEADDRQVIAIIGGDWCPDCVNLDAYLDQRPDLSRELQNSFVLVKINLSEENYNDDFIGQFPTYEWVPHFFIFASDGTLTDSYDTRNLMVDGVFDDAAFEDFLVNKGKPQ